MPFARAAVLRLTCLLMPVRCIMLAVCVGAVLATEQLAASTTPVRPAVVETARTLAARLAGSLKRASAEVCVRDLQRAAVRAAPVPAGGTTMPDEPVLRGLFAAAPALYRLPPP